VTSSARQFFPLANFLRLIAKFSQEKSDGRHQYQDLIGIPAYSSEDGSLAGFSGL
jgi:hypothetical protein